MRQTMACEVNQALNALRRAKDPGLIVHEYLRGIGGKFKSKRLSRIVSTWARGLVKDRLTFKASAGGSRRQQVNPSYSSQMCPRCGFVHGKNRQGDRFQCLFCGHGGDSDAEGAGQGNPVVQSPSPSGKMDVRLPAGRGQPGCSGRSKNRASIYCSGQDSRTCDPDHSGHVGDSSRSIRERNSRRRDKAAGN
jgi:hypothetical protein